MTLSDLKTFFRKRIKVVPGGPPVGTVGENRSQGLLESLDALAEEVKSGGNGNSKAGALSATTLTKTSTTVTYKLSPDLVPLVQALLAAGQKPVWTMPPGTQTPPVVVTPAPTQRTSLPITGLVADGVLGDQQEFVSGTDNATTWLAFQKQYTGLVVPVDSQTEGPTTPATAFRQQPPYLLAIPAGTGIIGSSNTKMLLGFRDFILDLGGNTLMPIYIGTDNFFRATIYRGEALQVNVLLYRGTKLYMVSPRFSTAQPGDTQLTVKPEHRYLLDPQVWYVGARFAPYSRENVLGNNSYPPGTIHNETPRIITDINYNTGVIKFTPALEYEHRDDWPDNLQTAGGGSGRGRLLALDDPRNPYKDYAEFRNGKMFASFAGAEGAIAYVANEVVYRNINSNRGSTPTESLTSTLVEDCDFADETEGDKLNGLVTYRRTRLGADVSPFNGKRGYVSNFGGCREVRFEQCYIGASAQVACKQVSFVESECWARAFATDNGTKDKISDPAVTSYAGFHATKRFYLKSLKLGAENSTKALLNPLELRTATVTSVDNGRAGFYWPGDDASEAINVWRGGQIGTRYCTLNGSKVGRQTKEIEFTGDVPAGTSGTFYLSVTGFTPEVGDVYEFSNVLAIVDDGGHTNLTPSHQARLYSEFALIWKGNQRTDGTLAPVTVTKNDLFFDGTGAYLVLRSKPTKITLTLPAALPGARLLVVGQNQARQATSDNELVRFGLGTAGTFFAGTAGASAGITATAATQTAANQWRPAAFGGTYHHTWVIYLDGEGVDNAHIPDFSLTIEHDLT